MQLSAASVQGLVDQAGNSVLTLHLGKGANADAFQIAAGEFYNQSGNTITFYASAALVTQTAQINVQYV